MTQIRGNFNSKVMFDLEDMFKCICRKIPNSVRNSRAKRELFVRTVAPVYRLMIKMFDQLKNSRHDVIADWLAGYFKSRHQVYIFSGLVLMGKNLAKRQTLFFLTLGRTRGGAGGNCHWGFSEFFPNYGKTSAADAFSSCLLIPHMHFETSLVMINYYGYEL